VGAAAAGEGEADGVFAELAALDEGNTAIIMRRRYTRRSPPWIIYESGVRVKYGVRVEYGLRVKYGVRVKYDSAAGF
jgi:hypothetical protein